MLIWTIHKIATAMHKIFEKLRKLHDLIRNEIVHKLQITIDIDKVLTSMQKI